MDLELPITIIDELTDDEVHSRGRLDLASGEIRGVEYEDYDLASQGLPALRQDYEFTLGVLRNGQREVEFRIEVDAMSGRYSLTANEMGDLTLSPLTAVATAARNAGPLRAADTHGPVESCPSPSATNRAFKTVARSMYSALE